MNKSLEVLTGSMLGDGALVHPRWGSSVHYYLSYSGTSHWDCVCDIAQIFASDGIPVSEGYPKPEKSISHGKPYDRITLLTRSCDLLVSEYRKWYDSGIKEVPVDVELTPVVVAQWFMDDGYAGKTRSRTLAVNIAAYAFSWESIEILKSRLYGLGVSVYPSIDRNVKTGSGVRLHLRQECINVFMDIIEPHVYPSFHSKIMRR